MLVELGTPTPRSQHDSSAPVVAYMSIPDDYTFKRDVDVEDWRKHLTHAYMHNEGITNYEDAEVLCQLTHPGAMFSAVASGDPTWVWSADADAARIVSEYFQIPISAADPNDLSQGHNGMIDETHWRRAGQKLYAPGVPTSIPDVQMLLINGGINAIQQMVGGWGANATTPSVGATGVGTAISSTSLSITGVAGTSWAGAIIYVSDTNANKIYYGVITGGSTGTVSVDQWYLITAPGGAAPSVGSTTGFQYLITFSITPAWFMGLQTGNITPHANDTSLSTQGGGGESNASGMTRKIVGNTIVAASGSGTSASTGTNALSATYTYGTSGSLPIYGMGLFTSLTVGDGIMFWETQFAGSFTVTTSGDQATVTDTISTS